MCDLTDKLMHTECTLPFIEYVHVSYRNSCDQWVLQQHLEETEHRIFACIFIWKWLVVYLTILLIIKVGKCYAHSV
jgi:hypothetical protein